jgi:ABC transport system ATP-binding/permease protein
MERLQLLVLQGGRTRSYDLRDGISIGRVEDNDVVIDHPSVSRRHAAIERRGDALWLVDLKSTNGIRVNGARLPEAKISSGRSPGNRLS